MTGVSASRIYARAARDARERGRLQAARGAVQHPPIFVLGSPRSGTTFMGRSLGSHPGLVDLGEVGPHKAGIFHIAKLPDQNAAVRKLRRRIEVVRTLALVRGLGFVEQTPETCFVLRTVLRAYPQAKVVHMIRDGRDVVCSLLERGWLSTSDQGVDDVGVPKGSYARPWVEADRRAEFSAASEATRAAWVWRRYVSAALATASPRIIEVRYETLVQDPAATARHLAAELDLDPEELQRAFASASSGSVGRWRRDLDAGQLADFEREAGFLLRELGYPT